MSSPKQHQPYRYYIILDFEATCEENNPNFFNEIIEFPSVVLDTQTMKCISEFRTFVKPEKNPILSNFCTTLTGITQEQVNGGVSLKEALLQYDQWIQQLFSKNESIFTFVTCGNWDLSTVLPKNCKEYGITLANYFKSFVNIKTVFKQFLNIEPMGMARMLEYLKLELVGKHHSGIDDCRNIARIVVKVMEMGCVVNETSQSRHKKKLLQQSCQQKE